MDIYHTITVSNVTHSLSSEKIPPICRQMSTGYTMYSSFTKCIIHNRIVEKLNIEISHSMPIHFYPRQHIYVLIGIKRIVTQIQDTHKSIPFIRSIFGYFQPFLINQLLLRFEPDQSSNLFLVFFF